MKNLTLSGDRVALTFPVIKSNNIELVEADSFTDGLSYGVSSDLIGAFAREANEAIAYYIVDEAPRASIEKEMLEYAVNDYNDSFVHDINGDELLEGDIVSIFDSGEDYENKAGSQFIYDGHCEPDLVKNGFIVELIIPNTKHKERRFTL